jgi:hypothetical protein
MMMLFWENVQRLWTEWRTRRRDRDDFRFAERIRAMERQK